MKTLILAAVFLLQPTPSPYNLNIAIVRTDHGSRASSGKVHGYGSFTVRGEGVYFFAFEFWAPNCPNLYPGSFAGKGDLTKNDITILALVGSGGAEECQAKIVRHSGTGTYSLRPDGTLEYISQHHA